MTIVSQTVDVLTSAEISAIPYSTGWTYAAIAVHSMQQISVPMFLRLEADDYAPLVIDFRHHAFDWALALENFPEHPFEIVVETEPTTVDAAPLFALPGRDLDSLLWEIGRHSFAGMPASWLRPYDRYKLTRWPAFTEHTTTLSQMRMTAMLGNVYLTAAELAIAAGVEETQAQGVLNAFSLMGILQSTATLETVPPPCARAIEVLA